MKQPPTPTCPACAYDLTGITLNLDGRVTCPECGITLRPVRSESVLTATKLHRLCYRRILLPTTVPGVLFLGLSTAPFPLGSILVAFYMLIGFIAIPAMSLGITLHLLNKSKNGQGPVRDGKILFSCLLYTLPGIAVYALIVWRYSAIALHV